MKRFAALAIAAALLLSACERRELAFPDLNSVRSLDAYLGDHEVELRIALSGHGSFLSGVPDGTQEADQSR